MLVLFFSINNVYADSLNDISKFAKEICDDIRPEGKINKSEVEAKLNGNISGIAKLIGGSLNIDGTISSGSTKYKGLPYEMLPTVMKDARECKQDIAKMLLNERSTIKRREGKILGEKNKPVTIVSNFKFLVDMCTKENETMTCSIIVTNEEKIDRNLIIYGRSRAFNSDGQEYQVSTVSLVDTNGFKLMLAGLPMKLKLRFESINTGEKLPLLEIAASVSRMKHHRFSAKLRNVSVTTIN